MTWTQEKPTEPGYYWYWFGESEEIGIMELIWDLGTLSFVYGDRIRDFDESYNDGWWMKVIPPEPPMGAKRP